MDVGKLLCTKDGRKIGNAIIIGYEAPYNRIKTDFGNIATMTDNEIEEFFYTEREEFPNHPDSVSDWFQGRIELFFKK